MFEYIPRFDDLSDIEFSDYRNAEEREFMTILNGYAAEWEQYDDYDDTLFMFYHGDDLCLGIEVAEFRSLRIDFRGWGVLMGKDGNRAVRDDIIS